MRRRHCVLWGAPGFLFKGVVMETLQVSGSGWGTSGLFYTCGLRWPLLSAVFDVRSWGDCGQAACLLRGSSGRDRPTVGWASMWNGGRDNLHLNEATESTV